MIVVWLVVRMLILNGWLGWYSGRFSECVYRFYMISGGFSDSEVNELMVIVCSVLFLVWVVIMVMLVGYWLKVWCSVVVVKVVLLGRFSVGMFVIVWL